jgi:hypothetical protein
MMAHRNVAMPVQENSQDHVDFLLSKIRVRYDQIEAEQQRLAVRALVVVFVVFWGCRMPW